MAEMEKEYIHHKSNLTINQNTRKSQRDALISEFLKEKYGYIKNGRKYIQAYRYYVETLSNGNRIYLQRPAYLNKGMDFQVCAEKLLKFKNGNDKPPSHKDIINDLKNKKKVNQKDFKILLSLIERVWNCEEPDNVLKGINLNFSVGFSVEALLKILKWLFIEQDMTYWSYSGRSMLWNGIQQDLS
jgi:hypothetical protein